MQTQRKDIYLEKKSWKVFPEFYHMRCHAHVILLDPQLQCIMHHVDHSPSQSPLAVIYDDPVNEWS